MNFGDESQLLQEKNNNPKPFHLRVIILRELFDDRCCAEIDTYTSLAEAINDARLLYILHNKNSDNREIDFRIFDNTGQLIYSVSKDALIGTFLKS